MRENTAPDGSEAVVPPLSPKFACQPPRSSPAKMRLRAVRMRMPDPGAAQGQEMRRRSFLGVAGSAMLWPAAAPAAATPVVGYLGSESPELFATRLGAARRQPDRRFLPECRSRAQASRAVARALARGYRLCAARQSDQSGECRGHIR